MVDVPQDLVHYPEHLRCRYVMLANLFNSSMDLQWVDILECILLLEPIEFSLQVDIS